MAVVARHGDKGEAWNEGAAGEHPETEHPRPSSGGNGRLGRGSETDAEGVGGGGASVGSADEKQEDVGEDAAVSGDHVVVGVAVVLRPFRLLLLAHGGPAESGTLPPPVAVADAAFRRSRQVSSVAPRPARPAPPRPSSGGGSRGSTSPRWGASWRR